MADNSHIEWTDATWNPITGCQIHSPGCINCYAMKLAGTRMKNHPSRKGLTQMTKNGPVWTGEVRFNEGWLDQPIRWKRPRSIFVIAHGDICADGVEREWQIRILGVMARATQHRYQILTKRPDRMNRLLMSYRPQAFPHVYIGTSVEDQKRARERREPMREIAEAGWNTWVSYEPALERVSWQNWSFIQWMVSGGESDTDGKSARPTHPSWHRETRDWCHGRGIPYLFKQWGEWSPTGSWMRDQEIDIQSARVVLKPNQRMIESGIKSGRTLVTRVGKPNAGRLLDGIEHNGFPWEKV